MVSEGDVLSGKFRVERVLGAGGMGVVVRAHHLELDTRVALKFLLPETLANPEAVTRFAREARAAAKITSGHVARVSDVGRLDTGAPYMVMEYLEGRDLSEWLRQRGPLPYEQAVDFLLQACDAIGEAHSLGIIHRDLKPANLFVVERRGVPWIKVLDFGISKLVGGGSDSGAMTRTSAIMGSPLYMSPEQIQSSKDVDARSDVWALGVILYECLTGRTPFTGEHMPELIFKIIAEVPPPVAAVRPDVPSGLDAVLVRCLAKKREERFGSVPELAAALAPFAPPTGIRSERMSGAESAQAASGGAFSAPAASSRQATTGGRTAAPWETAPAPGRPSGRRWSLLVATGLGAAALGAGGFVMTRRAAHQGAAASEASALTGAERTSSQASPALPPAPAVAPVVAATAHPSADAGSVAPADPGAAGTPAPAASTLPAPAASAAPAPARPRPARAKAAAAHAPAANGATTSDPWGGGRH